MIKSIALLSVLLYASFVFANPVFITDQVTGCSFHNQNPQPNETIKFEGKCNQTTAKGRLTWYLNGELIEIAEGQWKNGKQTGEGTYRFIKSKNTYVGQFEDGKRSGKGTFSWASGNTYQGDFVNGKRTGKGTFRWKDGVEYRGDFLDGKRTGKGTLNDPNGISYSGDFVDGRASGTGVWLDKSGARYTGEFLDGKFHGRGVLTEPNGIKYVGDFLEGYNSGYGVVTFTDGFKFQGEWLQCRPSGQGIFNYPNGDSIAGRFENGNFIPNISDPDHATCVKFGFASNSPEYRACRRQVDLAKQRAQEENLAYRQKLADLERQMQADRKESSVLRGLSALALGASLFSPPTPAYNAPSPMHIYNLPGGRTMTCNTWGAFTNCN